MTTNAPLKLGKCPRSIYELALTVPDQNIPKERVAEITGYSATSGGFNNAISELNTLGLIVRGRDGSIRLNPELSGL